MPIAVLSDIHGNMHYFNKVCDEIRKDSCDEVFYLGDAVGYFPHGHEAVSRLMAMGAQCLMGNHEAMLLGLDKNNHKKGAVYGLNETKKRMTRQELSFIAELLPFKTISRYGKRILMVHGAPWDPLYGYVYADTEYLNQINYDMVFMGHTHRPFIRVAGNTAYVNAGSCGLPRDSGNKPGYVYWDETDAYIKRVDMGEDRSWYASLNIHADVKQCLERRS